MNKQQNILKFWIWLATLSGLLALGLSPSSQAQNAPFAREQKPSLDRATAAARARNIGDARYALQLKLDDDSKTYSGQVTLDFTMRNRELPLQIDFVGGKVEELTINGKSARANYKGNHIDLESAYLRTGRNQVVVKFEHDYSSNGSGLYRVADPEDGSTYVVSDLEPYYANQLFPCFDQPDVKAQITLSVDAPRGWTIVSTVRESTITPSADAKRAQWQFPESPRISTYAFAIAGGPFKIWEDRTTHTPMRLLARQSHAPFIDFAEWFDITKRGMKFYEEYFGYRYPFTKYDQIVVPDLISGAMENVGAVTFDEGLSPRASATESQRLERTEVILHELAHMWFGNLVTMRWWDDLWLNESFATYMSFVAMDRALNLDATWRHFGRATKSWAYDADLMPSTHAVRSTAADTDSALSNFDGITYGKGAAILRQLAYYIGDDKFRDGMRQYFRSFAFRNATTEDFLGTLSKTAKVDLHTFASQWFDTTGLDTAEPMVSCRGGKVETFNVRQTTPAVDRTFRTQRVDVVTYKSDAKGLLVPDQRANVLLDGPENEIAVLKGRTCPTLVMVDPSDHGYLRVRFDTKSLNTIRKSLHKIASPDARMLIWQRLWLMLVSNEITLQEFETIAAQSLPNENQAMVFETASEMMIGSANGRTPSALRFWPEANKKLPTRQAVSDKWEDILWRKFAEAKASPEVQEIAFDRYLSIVSTDDGRNQLRMLLSSAMRSRGFVLDQDKRWRILLRLAILQDPNVKAAIKEEQKSDKSLEGKRWLRSITAAVGSEREKRNLLKDIADSDADMSFGDRQATLAYIAPLTQERSLTWLRDDYFSLASRAIKNADAPSAAAFVALAAPTSCDNNLIPQYQKLFSDDLAPLISNEIELQIRDLKRCVSLRN